MIYQKSIVVILYVLEKWDSNPHYIDPKSNALPIKLVSKFFIDFKSAKWVVILFFVELVSIWARVGFNFSYEKFNC